MRALRLVLCRLQPRWTFLPPQSTCGQHATATPKVLTARRDWLDSKSVGASCAARPAPSAYRRGLLQDLQEWEEQKHSQPPH